MAGKKQNLAPMWKKLMKDVDTEEPKSCLDHVKLAGKKQNIDPMWKVLNKEVDLGEPTSFLDHVYLGCTQRQCEISTDIVDSYRTIFESRISARATEKLPGWDKPRAKTSAWSCDNGRTCSKMRGTVLRLGKQKDGATIQSSPSLFGRSPNQKRKNWKIKGELSEVCSHIVLKCSYLARIG